MKKRKQEIRATIVNPEDLEHASINLTRALLNIWWKRNFGTYPNNK